MPVALLIFRLALVIPSARFQLKDKPGSLNFFFAIENTSPRLASSASGIPCIDSFFFGMEINDIFFQNVSDKPAAFRMALIAFCTGNVSNGDDRGAAWIFRRNRFRGWFFRWNKRWLLTGNKGRKNRLGWLGRNRRRKRRRWTLFVLKRIFRTAYSTADNSNGNHGTHDPCNRFFLFQFYHHQNNVRRALNAN